MKKVIIAICAVASVMSAAARNTSVSSPDKKITVTSSDSAGIVTFTLSHNGAVLLRPSQIALNTTTTRPATKITRSKNLPVKSELIQSPFYRQKEFQSVYNTQILTLDNGQQIEWRVFDDGAAYRFITHSSTPSDTVTAETAAFSFNGNPTVYLPHSTNTASPLTMAFQSPYTVTPLNNANPMPAFLPATADMDNGIKVTLLESDLESYPGMFVTADTTALALNALFAAYPSETTCSPRRMQQHVAAREPYLAVTDGSRTYPWRIMAVTTDDRQMPLNNLVYALAPESRIADTSWIKPGKVAWDWWNDWGLTGVPFKAGINTDTYKYYIDFAADNGIEYVVLDEGWYDPASGDMLTVIPEIDLPALISHARERGVRIVLWTVFNVLDKQLEQACRKYADMGVAGFKVDFLDRDDQPAVEMTHRIAEAAAEHNLILDYHGIYKPVGLNRTYPNVLNFEGVFGLEEVKWTSRDTDFPLYDVTFPYIRQMAGQSDYTPGAMRNANKTNWRAVYSRPMSMGTRAHQLASYIIHDSPFTMLCDAPTAYLKEPECLQFITALPTVFTSTDILQGKLGEYIVTSRYADGNWYVAGATNWQPRDIELTFPFLPEHTPYTATVIADGHNAHRQADDYTLRTITVDRTTTLPLHMAPGGGFAIILTTTHQP